MVTTSYAAFVPIDFNTKCKKSDAIVRGVVIDMVKVARNVEDSRGGDEKILEGEWSGPESVAVIRVISVIKGDAKKVNTIIFVPCGYNFDESPCELTKSKEYILFLESMGRNYFHPLDPFCMHRVQKEKVGMSGFDWGGDFDPENKDAKAIKLEEFIARIKKTATE